ncbi:copper amine oxidase N-terminal domain-containing protein [Paenibacillus radicis (ex Xue et al. 2023)]|uniref:Copper amine oxidase N-terminal domain-containing protein n=1 Tax=Paenibacillus radicis (ex Xue et al. 2023) TaxID=2972489 RepID=A0ABT1YED7_9BACL|nr:copper amine oxidase N-terminal domain-containing protein [Paenibacillus radicis (ex Xue et al. 2023)]MCR8631563.1 copper amine oxidase N-terminal domain-containing protein [Paenibacillus radicis (ex Xue et al. 2023)]
MGNWKSGTVGFVCGALFFSSLTYAADAVGIDVYFRNIKYYFNGENKQPPQDLQGFIYKNTTYVPLRFLSESLGKPVSWDDATSSIYVGDKPVENPTPSEENKKSSPGSAALQVFPKDNPWNTDISKYPVHQKSKQYIASIGTNTSVHADFGTTWQGAPIGIPYSIVGSDQPKVKVTFTDYGDESDPGPYPIPANAPIEGGPNSDGDRHVIVVDKDNQMLYELYNAHSTPDGWKASNGAKWDLNSNAMRPKYWTSADAAGLPIFPGLVRYEEALAGEINHALRFTVRKTQRGFIAPATHYASNSTDPNLPPMGLRLRLRDDFDISSYSSTNQAILRAMKKYGMIVADNGSDLYVSGAPDPKWDDDDLHKLSKLKGSDFEVVDTGGIEK